MRKIFYLPNDADIKQICIDDVKEAISRADIIRSHKIKTDGIKIENTVYYPNPDFSINEFLKIVFSECKV